MATALLSREFLTRVGGAPQHIDVSKLPRVLGAYTTRTIIEAMKKNDGGAAFYTDDVGNRLYRGKVVLLINKETGSAAEGFAWGMKAAKAAIVVGRRTAGAVLGSERFDLHGF